MNLKSGYVIIMLSPFLPPALGRVPGTGCDPSGVKRVLKCSAMRLFPNPTGRLDREIFDRECVV